MKFHLTIVLIVVLSMSALHAQDRNVGIGTLTPDVNAMLEVFSDEKGILIPRLTTAQRDAGFPGIGLAQAGLLIYNNSTDLFNYWDGTQWIPFPVGGVGATGPTGPTGPAGTNGADGSNGLMESTAIGPSPQCANGGYMIEEGLDDNGNDILEPGEIENTFYVCNGVNGTSGGTGGVTGPTGPTGPSGSAGPAGARGPTGPAGAQGPAGAIGPQGLQGLQGLAGAMGPPGPTGATGPSGPTVVSSDAGNVAGLGTDGYIYVPTGAGADDGDWFIAGSDVYKPVGTAAIGTATFGTWPLNIINSSFRRTLNISHTYSGNLATDAMYVVSTNTAAAGGAITRAIYAQAEKTAASNSTGEVQAATNWGINRYAGAAFSDAKGTVSLGYKYNGANGDAFGVFAEAFNEAGGTSYGIFAGTGVSPATEWAGFFSGDVFSTTGNYLPSDELLKYNIGKDVSSLQRILEIPVSNYRYKTDEYDFMHLPSGEQTGILAQDMERFFPELVKGAKHPGPSQQSVDAGIFSHHDAVEFKSVNYEGLIPHLIRAIQEMHGIIDQRDGEILQLTNRLNALEERLEKLESPRE